MDLFESDDELLLMELERRDGIYSFIFHELEANILPNDFEKNHNQMENNIDKAIGFRDFLNENQLPSNDVTSQLEKAAPTTSCTSVVATGKNSYSLGDRFLNKTSQDFRANRQTNLNFQFPLSAANSPFQQFCTLHTFSVRRPKTPFSQLYSPLVRNRRHKLKEAKEYNNFMDNITQVADLRALFPLDPDVHAPFQTKREKL